MTTMRPAIMAVVLGLGLPMAQVQARSSNPNGQAREAPRDIAIGDPQRAMMLDALHKAVDRELGQPSRFIVRTLRVQGRWGHAVVDPRTPSGGRIDMARTSQAEAAREGLLDGDTIHALLERRKTGWTIRAWMIAPTDVGWAGWPADYGVPYELLGLPAPD
ncbi:hypothetical protein [Sphingomonas colocasiae]|uniref:Uncharacterized protein n=1 Tax=Sphingomonas colocasiae TaxID=1848973 RepID=A0ABS7PM62_9SPHN|nr:hypothetical protein [Sphingomonas colocasiae]MBY8822343.1 hypothetical protein [Sphingomonas colocasiae]